MAVPGNGEANDCPEPYRAASQVPGIAYYKDGARVRRDESRFQENRDLLAEIDTYLAELGKMSDRALEGDAAAGQCALSWLVAWAGEDALASAPNRQARSQKRWTAAAMGLNALKLWPQADAEQRRLLRGYLDGLAGDIEEEVRRDGVTNNHLYWAGLHYAVVGALGSAERRREAIAICRDALSSLTAHGSLPLEDRRGARAVNYNGFALFPLALIARLVEDGECKPEQLAPLAEYITRNSDETDNAFMRWAPILGSDIDLPDRYLSYRYAGGDLNLLDEVLERWVQASSR